jgi:hypothetical protein
MITLASPLYRALRRHFLSDHAPSVQVFDALSLACESDNDQKEQADEETTLLCDFSCIHRNVCVLLVALLLYMIDKMIERGVVFSLCLYFKN